MIKFLNHKSYSTVVSHRSGVLSEDIGRWASHLAMAFFLDAPSCGRCMVTQGSHQGQGSALFQPMNDGVNQ